MIVIVDYGLGNLGSMSNMLIKIGVQGTISSDPKAISKANRLILPGVGAFDNGMKNLASLGLIQLLNQRVIEDKVPILGVCLGMQLLGERSQEGQLPGLGWIAGQSIRFKFDNANNSLKIPHMGWNQLTICQKHSLFKDLEAENRFYFVHSYHLLCVAENNILAKTSYGFDFTSAVVKDNILGVQFHPEKSHMFGMRLLKNFAGLV